MRGKVERRSEERGFTLIELLVVVMIIGILAGIAIPVFLAQRQRAYRAAAASDAKSMATSQYGYFSDDSEFSATVSGLEPIGFRRTPHVEHAVCVADGGASFVVAARDVRTDTIYLFEGEDGQLVEREETGTDITGVLTSMGCTTTPSTS